MHQIFIDESQRGNTYILCATVIADPEIPSVRPNLKSLVGSGHNRFHMSHETHSLRNRALEILSSIDCQSFLYLSSRLPGDSSFGPRERCLKAALSHPINVKASHIWLERSSTPYLDKRCIERFIQISSKPFPYVAHQTPESEPLLWIPDILSWSYGRKGIWRAKASAMLSEIIRI